MARPSPILGRKRGVINQDIIGPEFDGYGSGGLDVPYSGTNLFSFSNDITQNRTLVNTPVITFDQTGVTGDANDASWVEDNASSFEYAHRWYDHGSNSTDTWTVRYFIGKQDAGDGNNPDYANVGVGSSSTSPGFWASDSNTILAGWAINTITGATLERYNNNSATIAVAEHGFYTDWWEVKIDFVGQNYHYFGCLLAGAFNTSWITSSSAAAQGHYIIGNTELYHNTAKEDVSGGPVYT